jgi:hypothetical protein
MEDVIRIVKMASVELKINHLESVVMEQNSAIERLNKEVSRLRTLEKNRCWFNARQNPRHYLIADALHNQFITRVNNSEWGKCLEMIEDGIVSPYEFDILKGVCAGARKDEDGAINFVKHLLSEYKINTHLVSNDLCTPVQFANKAGLDKLSEYYKTLEEESA